MNTENQTEARDHSDRAIIIKFERTNIFTRWPCHVCGGYTDKDAVLCESNGANDDSIRVCPECLRAGNIDERLEQRAQMYERWPLRPGASRVGS